MTRAEGPFEDVLGQPDANGVRILLGCHLDDLASDQLHSLVLEKAEVGQTVVLLRRPQTLFRLNFGYRGHWRVLLNHVLPCPAVYSASAITCNCSKLRP